ncbi:MAG: serine--tRNA ligase [bacterium]|nr:serine--tRNA ligase [bacterium]
MLDISFIRENPDKVKEGIIKKGYDPILVDKVLESYKKWVDVLQKVDELRGERNKISEQRTTTGEQRGREIKEELKELEPQLNKVEEEYNLALREIPNLPLPNVPIGKDESENKVLRKWGEPKKFPFTPKDHLELGEALDIIDVQRAAKVSGARFAYLKGDAALLEFALVQFAFQQLTKEKFIPLVPPVLVQEEAMRGMGFMEHGGREDMYILDRDGLVLAGTSEQSVGPMHSDEVFEKEELPKRYVAFSSCFRREAGSYGKDTRGILRVHQFDKVEMFSFVAPEDSQKEHEYLLSLEEKLFRTLEIPYQIVQMCTGDLGHPSASKFDIEAWMPGQEKYREVTSTSNTTDYQARRLNIKYRDGGETKFTHTVNGTVFAIGRTIIAILENYQQKDGSVIVPEVLRLYMGKDRIIPKSA